jgi:hypothetical protein
LLYCCFLLSEDFFVENRNQNYKNSNCSQRSYRKKRSALASGHHKNAPLDISVLFFVYNNNSYMLEEIIAQITIKYQGLIASGQSFKEKLGDNIFACLTRILLHLIILYILIL